MLLETHALVAGYMGVAAIHEIDLCVEAGEVVTVLGANGAGKSTLLLTIAGEIAAMSGTTTFDGRTLTGPMHRRVRAGIGVVPEERSIFRDLTVHENLVIGSASPALAYELAPELKELRQRRAGLLSGGEQQILTLARALAARPKLLLADELSLGLAPLVADRMLQFVRQAADEGVGVLIVEQQAARALKVADRAYVMRRGRIVLQDTAEGLGADLGRLSETYLSSAVRSPDAGVPAN